MFRINQNQTSTISTQNKIKKTGRTLNLRDDRGMSTVEYIILMAVIVVGSVGVWNTIGTKVKTELRGADTSVQTLDSTTMPD